MNADELRAEIRRLGPRHHDIEIAPGVRTGDAVSPDSYPAEQGVPSPTKPPVAMQRSLRTCFPADWQDVRFSTAPAMPADTFSVPPVLTQVEALDSMFANTGSARPGFSRNTCRRQPRVRNVRPHHASIAGASAVRRNPGKRAVNYAQWPSTENFEAMCSNPEAAPHMKAASDLASFDLIACVVSDSIGS